MLRRDLPPAGNPIALAPARAACAWPDGYRALPVNSGTAALALALLAARLRNPQVESPVAILPGYGCPDLVAAARFAGVRAVLADIGADDPGYDLAALRDAIDDNTVAVVAVNFLGIAERHAALRALLQPWPQAVLVEDDAQWFPEPFPGAGLHGDAVCLSFGRGKPVSLLGGGMLLLRDGAFPTEVVTALRERIGPAVPDAAFALKARLYNALSSPSFYAAINRNPLLKLGQTVFKPLHTATALDARRQALLPVNIERHVARPRRAAEWLDAGLPASMNLPARLAARCGRLLRYPLLCADRAQRDVLLERLQAAGLGATALYQRVLPEVEGVGDQVEVRGGLNGSQAFADRLITLPVHAGVTEQDVARMLAIVAN